VSTDEYWSGGAARIDMTKPHPARRYDYWLGGKDNFQADRDAAEAIAAVFPHIRTAARENRAFMRRAVSFLAAEAGIRQFLDIGTGLPTANNVHDVAQGIAPESHVVYVDNDPLVLTHARALLTSSTRGATAYIDADVRDPEKILSDPAVQETLNLSEPVALLLVAVLHFVEDGDDPYGIVNRLVSALPAGSYLVLSHATFDPLDRETIAAMDAVNEGITPRFCPRALGEVSRFFEGLDLLEPGIVSVSDWRPEPGPRPTPAEATGYGAVAAIR
jgi:hypothetical protein